MNTSIPELIAKHGSIAATCRETGLSEITIACAVHPARRN